VVQGINDADSPLQVSVVQEEEGKMLQTATVFAMRTSEYGAISLYVS
jgi:hypothetical protein